VPTHITVHRVCCYQASYTVPYTCLLRIFQVFPFILFLRIEFDMYRTLKKEFDMYVNVMYYVHASILVHTKVPSVATLGEYVHAWTGGENTRRTFQTTPPTCI
jgi:hypothetical protein